MSASLSIHQNPSKFRPSPSFILAFDLEVANKSFHYPDPLFHPSIHFVPVAQVPLSTFTLPTPSAFPCRIISSLVRLTKGRPSLGFRTNLISIIPGTSSSFLNRLSLACSHSAHMVSTLRVWSGCARPSSQGWYTGMRDAGMIIFSLVGSR
jgi:hypothetical protein